MRRAMREKRERRGAEVGGGGGVRATRCGGVGFWGRACLRGEGSGGMGWGEVKCKENGENFATECIGNGGGCGAGCRVEEVDGAGGEFAGEPEGTRSDECGAQYRAGAVRAELALAEGAVQDSGVVSRCEVRHLGALVGTVRAGAGRLVWTEDVHPGRPGL